MRRRSRSSWGWISWKYDSSVSNSSTTPSGQHRSMPAATFSGICVSISRSKHLHSASRSTQAVRPKRRSSGGRGARCRRQLPRFQNNHLQSLDIGKVPGVGRQQAEITLDRLRRKPQIVDANVRVSSGLFELCTKNPERLARFDGDPQLGFSTQPAEHCRGSLLLKTGPQQIQTEANLSDVDGREIDRFLPSDGVDIGPLRALRVPRRSRGWYRSASPRIPQLRHAPRRLFRWEATAADNASAVSSSSVRYKSPNTLKAS